MSTWLTEEWNQEVKTSGGKKETSGKERGCAISYMALCD